MNIYITLDYELFFGDRSGSVDQCIIQPTEELLKIVNPYDIKFTCFVDSGYLLALEKQKSEFPDLEKDYIKITDQIRLLANNKHRIELHIHPHWEDSYYNGSQWIFDTSRYKLSNFQEDAVLDIVTRYNEVLKRVSGKSPVAYRAGGWSAQPFPPIGKALAKNNISIDSSVYPGGKYISVNQVFDFSRVPQYQTEYRFMDDLTSENASGEFVEIPISSYKVSPSFYWRFVLTKLQKHPQHRPFGNGSAIALSKKETMRLLTSYSRSVVSIDGLKASLIGKAFEKYKKHTENNGNFVLIGHPKAFSPFSLKKVSDFIRQTHSDHHYKTFL